MLLGKAILARNNRMTIPRPHKKMKHVLHGLLIFYGYQNHCSDVHFGGSRSQLSFYQQKLANGAIHASFSPVLLQLFCGFDGVKTALNTGSDFL